MSGLRHFPRKLLALSAALLLLPAGGALASQSYQEQVGDAPGGAPDTSAVVVGHKLSGEIRVAVTFANRTTLAGEDLAVVSMDTDQNPMTGDWGEDYWLGVWGDEPGTAYLYQVTGVIVTPVGNIPLTTLRGMLPVAWSGQTMAVAFSKTQVGVVKGFDFSVITHTGGDMSQLNTEYAPHNGMWSYSVETLIDQIQLVPAVTKVRAGKVFSARASQVKLNTDELFTPESLTGKATVGGKALKSRAGGLAWNVPKAAKGKRLVVTLNASYQGMQKTQSFTLRITK